MPQPQATAFDRAMQRIEAELKQLEAEYNMFFSGRLPRPPWETRNRVSALVKKWDRGYIQSAVDRFQYAYDRDSPPALPVRTRTQRALPRRGIVLKRARRS